MDATPHIIESALLLLAAFLLGCVIGYFARRLAGVQDPVVVRRTTTPEVEQAPPASAAPTIDQGPDVVPLASAVPIRKKPATPRKSTVGPDDLKAIKGIGPRLEAILKAHGIDSYAQIAKLTKKAAAELDAELSLRGRIEREQWVEQAKALIKEGADG